MQEVTDVLLWPLFVHTCTLPYVCAISKVRDRRRWRRNGRGRRGGGKAGRTEKPHMSARKDDFHPDQEICSRHHRISLSNHGMLHKL